MNKIGSFNCSLAAFVYPKRFEFSHRQQAKQCFFLQENVVHGEFDLFLLMLSNEAIGNAGNIKMKIRLALELPLIEFLSFNNKPEHLEDYALEKIFDETHRNYVEVYLNNLVFLMPR